MEERSTCLSPACGATVEGTLTKCPECGWAMRGPRNIRVRGWGLVGLCPGPAIVNLATFLPQVFLFVVAMAAGMFALDWWRGGPAKS